MVGVDGLRRWVEHGEQVTFRLGAKLVFLIALVVLAFVGLATSRVGIALFATIIFGLMLRVILPTDEFQEWSKAYWSGDAGDLWRIRLHSFINSILGILR